MRIIKAIKTMQSYSLVARYKGVRIGFVPTMGALHEGHVSLIRQARKENDLIVVSIFVNPTQFAPGEDYERYPRNSKGDTVLLRAEGVDILFYPERRHMYDETYATTVFVDQLSTILCGASRPGHFTGVTTVVAKLFNTVMPHSAYFGQKDYQQAVIIKKMVSDLNMPVRVNIGKTVRARDGLALSSRNAYLKGKDRTRACSLYASLNEAKQRIRSGERIPQKIVAHMRRKLVKHVDRIDYIAVRDAATLQAVKRITGKIYIGIAAHVGRTRLIDNMIINVS